MAVSRNRDFSYRMRPVFRVDLFTRNFTKDPINGLIDEWKWYNQSLTDKEVVEWLVALLDDAYDLGYRDFALYMPAGGSQTSSYAGANQWHTIPEERRVHIQEILGSWISGKASLHPTGFFTFGLYISIPARNDNDYKELDLPMDDITLPKIGTAEGNEWLTKQVINWVEMGVNRVWLEGGSDETARDELGGESLYNAALEQKDFYESLGIRTVGADSFPITPYEYENDIQPVPESGEIDQDKETVMPWTCTSDWLDIWDTKTEPFYFTYDYATRRCYASTSDGEYLLDNFFYDQFYDDYFEDTDLIKIDNSSEILVRGKYKVNQIYDAGSIELFTNAFQDCQSLPGTAVNDVLALYCEGIISHGRATDYWMINNFGEMGIILSYDACYTDDRIKGFMELGFRVGANTDLTIAGSVMDNYTAWIGEKSIFRRIVRRHH